MKTDSSLNKTWEVKYGGRVLIALYYEVFAIVIYFLFVNRNSSQSFNDALHDTAIGILIFFPVNIAVFILPIIWILKKRIPRKINLIGNTLSISYKNGKIVTLNKENTAFSQHIKSGYSMIIFYNKFKSRRGHYVYKEITDLAGINITNSWNNKMINSIADTLKEEGFEKREVKDKKGFFVRAFG